MNSIRYCRKCGEECSWDDRFCQHCRAELPPPKPIETNLGPVPEYPPPQAPPSKPEFSQTELGLMPDQLLLSRYRIQRELGMGGMGRVYLATDERLGILVAVKVLREVLSRDPGSVQRLIAEAKLAIRLAHPNVVRVNNFENGEFLKFLVMEYVEGETLAHKIARDKKLPEEEVKRIAIEICRGLEHAHQKKVIHRDIKPGNILLAKSGEIKIADFGIARECRDSMSRLTSQVDSGTLLYMSPEQMIGESNEASDVYSLGVVLYEMLTGQPPFRSGDIPYQIREIVPKPPAGLSPELSAIVLRCLQKKPDNRFPSVREMREELDGSAEVKRREEQRRAEESRRLAEEKRKQEEARQQAELEAKQKAEELRAAEMRRAEEERIRAEQQRKAEDVRRRAEERHRQAEDTRRQSDAVPGAIPALKKPISNRRVAIGIVAVGILVVIIWLMNSGDRGVSTPPFQDSSNKATSAIRNSPTKRRQPPATPPEETKATETKTFRPEKKQLEQNPIGPAMEFVSIPAGRFTMGCSPDYSPCGDDENPRHEVTISRGFELGKYEVTQGQWVKVMGNNPSNFKGDDRLPVEQVSWNDTQAFIAKLNALNDGYRYRLPTEAEWEYAARGGTAGPRRDDLDVIAWFNDNSGGKTHLVGEKQPNGYGLYDMLGNVYEWCSDWYGESYYRSSPAVDPKGPSSELMRVLRGGSFKNYSDNVRISDRSRNDPGNRKYGYNGFRLCRERL
jgi:formylglycine-generating enzyme required for sulfatase activity